MFTYSSSSYCLTQIPLIRRKDITVTIQWNKLYCKSFTTHIKCGVYCTNCTSYRTVVLIVKCSTLSNIQPSLIREMKCLWLLALFISKTLKWNSEIKFLVNGSHINRTHKLMQFLSARPGAYVYLQLLFSGNFEIFFLWIRKVSSLY